jgi:hypothetical protein
LLRICGGLWLGPFVPRAIGTGLVGHSNGSRLPAAVESVERAGICKMGAQQKEDADHPVYRPEIFPHASDLPLQAAADLELCPVCVNVDALKVD